MTPFSHEDGNCARSKPTSTMRLTGDSVEYNTLVGEEQEKRAGVAAWAQSLPFGTSGPGRRTRPQDR